MSGSGRLVIAKVGGSLLDWPPLPACLARFIAPYRGRGDRMALIAGGGGAADWIRELDRIHALGDEAAHSLAVRALDLTAHALAAMLRGSEVVESPAALDRSWDSGRLPILAPRLILDEDDRLSAAPLPRSWDCTTDSIAARVATILGAHELVLLKSLAPPPGATREEMAGIGLVDPVFPEASRSLPRIMVLNLRDEASPASPQG